MTGRCDHRCPTPSSPIHSNDLPGEESQTSGSPTDPEGRNQERKGRRVERESGEEDEEEEEEESREEDKKAKMHLQVGNQSYSSRSCSASPTRHLGTLPPFSSPPSRTTPLSPLKCQPNSSMRGLNLQRNRTNSLTVEMGSFPFRPLPQRSPCSQRSLRSFK